MKFYIKPEIEVFKNTIRIEFPRRLKKELDLNQIEIKYSDSSENINILMIANTIDGICSNSVIFSIIDLFNSKNINYEKSFTRPIDENGDLEQDRYYLDTNEYELSDNEKNQLVGDFIDSLKEALALGPITSDKLNKAFIQFGFQPPGTEKQEKAISLSSSNLSMFRDNSPPLYSEFTSDETESETETETENLKL